MATTQDQVQIDEIRDSIALLKDGGAAVVIQTNAVNFGLLSMEEQIAIIGSFAQMLNSLSFPIQITILSKRLDISAYLKLLEKAQSQQTNPLLSQMMIRYRRFIQSLIKDNEVLDKKFYITVPLSPLELGVGYKSKEDRYKKAKTVLEPKRDQVMRQLNRVGLTSKQLTDTDLAKLFFEIFNSEDTEAPQNISGSERQPDKAPLEGPAPEYPPPVMNSVPPEPPHPVTSTEPIPAPAQVPQAQAPLAQAPERPRANHPFVVEELRDSP